MANLADQIKRNSQLLKRGSQLFETAPESLFSQVQRQGLAPGAAVSPQAAAGMGVTADQAKMAGSAAQVQKAVRESIQPGRQITAQPTRLVTSEQEQAAKQRAGELSKLESLGTRIGGLVNTYAQEAAAQAAQVKPVANEQLIKNDLPNATPEQLAKIKTAIETGTIDAELWTLFPQAKSAQELTTALAKYSKVEKDLVTAAMKDAFGPDVTLAQLKPDDFSALGLAGLGDIATLLGRKEDELRTMTIDQFQQAINQLVSQDFDRVQELTSIANDAFYPANVRAAAQSELRDLSSVGVQATEAEVAKMNEAIQSADLITIGDEQMTVAELLSDEGLTSVITSYLEDTDGDYQKLIQGQFGPLADFIETNRDVLKQAASNLSEAAKTSAGIQQSNAKLETATDAKVSMTDFNKLVFGADYDPSKPSNIDWSTKKSEAHKILDPDTKEFSEAEKSDYARFLNEMARINPDLLKSEFLNLNAAALRAKVPAGISFQTYLGQLKDYHSNLKNLADPNLSNDRAVFQAFGDDTGDNFRNFVDSHRQLNLLANTGLGTIPAAVKPLLSILDAAMVDGKLDVATVRRNLANFLKSSDFNLNSGKSLYDMVRGIGYNLNDTLYSTIWAKVKDGELTAEEAGQIMTDDRSDNLTGRLYDLLESKGLKVQEGVGKAVEEATKSRLLSNVKATGLNPDILNLNSQQKFSYIENQIRGKNVAESKQLLADELNRAKQSAKMLSDYVTKAGVKQKLIGNELLSSSNNLISLLEQRLRTLSQTTTIAPTPGRAGAGGGPGYNRRLD